MTAVLGNDPVIYSFLAACGERQVAGHNGRAGRTLIESGRDKAPRCHRQFPRSDPIRYITGEKKRRVEKLFAKSQEKCWQIPGNTVPAERPRLRER